MKLDELAKVAYTAECRALVKRENDTNLLDSRDETGGRG